MSPNVLGHVTELVENAVLDEKGEIVPDQRVIKLKLKLRNTLGKEREVWVEGPADLSNFYSTELGL